MLKNDKRKKVKGVVDNTEVTKTGNSSLHLINTLTCKQLGIMLRCCFLESDVLITYHTMGSKNSKSVLIIVINTHHMSRLVPIRELAKAV